MNKISPKISVVMSVFNGESYLHESIETILSQTFNDFEFIIIDDYSKDDTWKILTKYAEQDKRIKLVKNEHNLGLTKSLNKGIKLAQGEYIARQDADDISLPKRFEKQIEILNNSPEVVLVSCNIEVINSQGVPIRKYEQACDSHWVNWYLLFYNHVNGHSQVMFRRKAVEDLGYYSEIRRYSQDYELWCRLSRIGSIVILPETLQKMRIHNDSTSAVNSSKQQTLSLEQSKGNIEQLIGKEISLEETKNLRLLWSGHYWWKKSLPNSKKVRIIHSRQKEIYQAFIKQHDMDLVMSQQLRHLIGQHFIYWIQSLSILRRLPSRIWISLYAFTWHPLGVLKLWFEECKRVITYLLTTRKNNEYITTKNISTKGIN